MDKEELLRKLSDIRSIDDTEQRHIDADELLLQYIDDPEIRAAFEVINKWYA